MANKLSQSRQRLVQTLRSHHQQISDIISDTVTPHHRMWHSLRWVMLAALLVGIGASILTMRYSLVPVSLVGIPVTNSSSQASLEQQLTDKLKDYVVAVENENGSTKSFKLNETGVTVDVPQSVQYARASQKPDNPLKRLRWWDKKEVPVVLQTNSEALDNFVQNQLTHIVTPAQDAAISIDAGNVTITPEQSGESYTLHAAPAALRQAVSNLQTKPLKLSKQPVEAAISQEGLQPVAENIKAVVNQKVILTINGQPITVKPADVGTWVEIAPVPANHTADFTVNSGKVLSYMNALAKQYIQPPVTQIVMPTPGGGTTVLVPGRNGVDITNKESTAADIAQQLLAKNPVTVTLPVQYATFKTITAEPRDKWIVVDTSTKRMYAYEQNNLVRSFLISAGAPQTPTVLGEYKIYAKYPVQDMRGANADGSRYFQPAVKWVNYFYRDYAIHGNYWRPLSYFGNINSSHGCVGIVDADAKWLYDWAPIGTTVIVHK